MASKKMQWRVHTQNLLKELVESNEGMGILSKPVTIFGRLLAAVGERAAELNDEKLNALMIRLAIYSVADPGSPDYDPEIVHRYLEIPIEI
ncbi:MAG: hypothetical protein IT327_07725 [Anaerolineae bacterium]|nr:hypothetical protein [Anaerolineae bacterium]